VVRWRHLEGDFARNEGAWRLRALDGRRTLVRYDAVVQFRRWVPSWLIARAQRRGAQQLLRSLEERAQARMSSGKLPSAQSERRSGIR